VSKPADAFRARTSKVRAYSTGGATTTKEEQQQYAGSGSGNKEIRSPAYPAAGVRRTLYDVLGLSKTASAKEIKAAYRQAARKLHPDVVPAEQREDSTKMFLQMQNAYNVLSDDESRAAYDLRLSVQSSYITSCNWGFTTASSPSYGGPTSYPAADFSSAFKGRSWETDQCW
jgi:DnaJ-class molecular chaperone